jgi:alkylation response protein AidB-like acyl-CoA dehydrogenase
VSHESRLSELMALQVEVGRQAAINAEASLSAQAALGRQVNTNAQVAKNIASATSFTAIGNVFDTGGGLAVIVLVVHVVLVVL